MKPNLGMKADFHFINYFLKPSRKLVFLIPERVCSQSLVSKFNADVLLLKTLWIGVTRNCEESLR